MKGGLMSQFLPAYVEEKREELIRLNYIYFGLSRGCGSSLPRPQGDFSASSWVNNSSSASTFPASSISSRSI